MEANVFRLDRVLVGAAGTGVTVLLGDDHVDGELLRRGHRGRRRGKRRSRRGGLLLRFRVVAEDQGRRDADAADKHREDRERREQFADGLHLLPCRPHRHSGKLLAKSLAWQMLGAVPGLVPCALLGAIRAEGELLSSSRGLTAVRHVTGRFPSRDHVPALRRERTPRRVFPGLADGDNVGGTSVCALRPCFRIRRSVPRCRGGVRPRHHRASWCRRGRRDIR